MLCLYINPQIWYNVDMKYRIAILTTEINPEVIKVMVEAATTEATRLGVDIREVAAPVGCLDMPVIAKYLLKKKQIDGLVVLGAVAQGETKHDELVVNTMTEAIVHLSVEYMKPVGFGVIGPAAKVEHFMPRAEEYAQRAVQAVVVNLDILKNKK